MGIDVDVNRLWEMLEELDPKQRAKALKQGLRMAARTVRRAAVRNMTSGSPALQGRTSEVARGIRAVVYRKAIGFRVTVGTKRTNYKTAARDNKEKAFRRLRVVPLWAEGGTVQRRTRGGLFRKGASRGSMRPYRFMERAERETMPGVETTIRKSIESSIEKTVKKYGSNLT